MAVETKKQTSGVGRAIVFFAENIAKEKGYVLLMMHARDAVIPFYQKCGYHISGNGFEEVGIPHHRMEKQLEHR
jgi:predicted GNAT family N-acyltransferase